MSVNLIDDNETEQQAPTATQRMDEAPGATQRMDDDFGGTERMEVGAGATSPMDQVAGGTERMDSPAGTERMATERMPAGGTERMDGVAAAGGTSRMDHSAAPAPAAKPQTSAQGEYFAAGQVLELNGQPCKILRELNSKSGEAVTYVVEHGGEVRVLKHYRPGIRISTDLLQRIKGLRDTSDIIRLYDFGVRNDQDFEVMEYASGGTLADELRERGPIKDPVRLKSIVRQIVNGLELLHGKEVGAVYQDLKPENILFRDEKRHDVVLADFGISTLMKEASGTTIVKAQGTREYSAPELARFGNHTDAQVNAKVDYFALGITLLECWTGQRPFQGQLDAIRMGAILNKAVPFPEDMDDLLATLIKGLINPLPIERWDATHVKRWLNGTALTVEYNATRRPYESRTFKNTETFATPAELAELLERYPDKGEDYLYLDRIRQWLDTANDMELATEIEKIVKQFGVDPKNTKLLRAGLIRAIYVLDPLRPFKTVGGTKCYSLQDIGDAFLAERSHYENALRNPHEPFYMYLEASGATDLAARFLSSYHSEQTPEYIFNLAIYTLHGGGEARIRINGRNYSFPEEIDAGADPATKEAIVSQIKAGDSRVLIWLLFLGRVEATKPFASAEATDMFAILKSFPWLDIKDLLPDWSARQAKFAAELVRQRRPDLLDVFLAQGLDLQSQDGKGVSALHLAAGKGQEDMVAYLLDRGCSVDPTDQDGNTPLFWALQHRHQAAVDGLLARGANVNHANQAGLTALGQLLTPTLQGKQKLAPDADLLEKLLVKGANPNQALQDGRLPLHMALWEAGSPSLAGRLLDLLLQHGADPWADGNDVSSIKLPAYPALMAAILAYEYQYQRHADALAIVARLAKGNPGIDKRYAGKTMLHYAATWGAEDLCRTLLDQGANKKAVTDDDELPVNFALAKKNSTLEQLLSPGAAFGLLCRTQGWLGRITKFLALWILFLSLEPLAKVVQTLADSRAGEWVASYLVLQAFLVTGLMVWEGSPRIFWSRLRGTVTYLRGILSWFVVLPLVMPLVMYTAAYLLALANDALGYGHGPLAEHWRTFQSYLTILPNLVDVMADKGATLGLLAMAGEMVALAAITALACGPMLRNQPVWAKYKKARG